MSVSARIYESCSTQQLQEALAQLKQQADQQAHLARTAEFIDWEIGAIEAELAQREGIRGNGGR